MPKLCVFTVMTPDLTPEKTAKALAEYGYEGVEWRVKERSDELRQQEPSFWGNNLATFDPTPAEAERARDLSQSAGLAVVGLGTYIDVGDLELTEAALEFAKVCGAGQFRVGVGNIGPGVTYTQAYQKARTYLNEVVKMAQQYRIPAVVEIHHNTIIPSASLAHRLINGLDPEWIGVIHDAGNMVKEGYEPYRIGLDLLGPYLKHVHVKNARYGQDSDGKWQANWSAIDQGIVDFDDLFTALRDAGYDGWIGVEDFSGAYPTREALQYDRDFLLALIDRIY